MKYDDVNIMVIGSESSAFYKTPQPHRLGISVRLKRWEIHCEIYLAMHSLDDMERNTI
jgi:hypothetical protein